MSSSKYIVPWKHMWFKSGKRSTHHGNIRGDGSKSPLPPSLPVSQSPCTLSAVTSFWTLPELDLSSLHSSHQCNPVLLLKDPQFWTGSGILWEISVEELSTTLAAPPGPCRGGCSELPGFKRPVAGCVPPDQGLLFGARCGWLPETLHREPWAAEAPAPVTFCWCPSRSIPCWTVYPTRRWR